MLFKLVVACCFVFVIGLYEGDYCTVGDQTGTCTNIGQCQSAINSIKQGIDPQICGFNGPEPIVCCFDYIVSTAPSPFQPPVATTQPTTKRTVREITTMYIPPVYDYEYKDTGVQYGGCEPIPTDMTAKKTGEKAFDKCIEYQAKYVYPCEKAVDMTGDMTRSNDCHHNGEPLIIGGSATARHEFPHMVLLGFGDSIAEVQWLCGGTIISEKYILTAGHCLGTDQVGNVKYVVVGALTRQDTKIRDNIYEVKRLIPHPKYNPFSKYNDIAVLELKKPIALSQYVVPACLDVGNVNASRVLATGWGATQFNGRISNIMEKVILEKFSTQECAKKYGPQRDMKKGFDPDTQTCYGDRTQPRDTCQGDSGGPIQIKSQQIYCMYVVVGVTSFGRACGFVSEPGVYTRVRHYVPWIESVVWPDGS